MESSVTKNNAGFVESEESVEYVAEETSGSTITCEKVKGPKHADNKIPMMEIVDLTANNEKDSPDKLVDLAPLHLATANNILQICDSLANRGEKAEGLRAENPHVEKIDNQVVLEIIKNNHIVTTNKLDLLLKYFEDELAQERTKRLVLEQKLSSIDKLIQNFENENVQVNTH